MTEAIKGQLEGYLPQIRQVVSRIAKDQGVLDDITQECCVCIIEKEHLWSCEQGTLGKWINALTRHVTIDYLRKHWRRPETLASDDGLIEAPADRDFSIEDIRWVVSQFQHLTPMQKKVMQLKYIEGMKGVDIARELDITPATVSQYAMQALETLRRKARSEGLLAMVLPWNWDLSGIIMEVTMGLKAKTVVVGLVLVGTGAIGTKMIEPYFENDRALQGSVEALALSQSRSERERLENENKLLLSERDESRKRLAQLSEEIGNLKTRMEATSAASPGASQAMRLPSGETLDQVVGMVKAIDSATSAKQCTELINKLILFGKASIPEIKALLSSKGNHIYDGSESPSQQYGEYPSFRIGLLHALREIGGTESLEVAKTFLPSAQDPLELFEITQFILDCDQDVGAYQSQVSDSLKGILARESKSVAWQQTPEFAQLQRRRNDFFNKHGYKAIQEYSSSAQEEYKEIERGLMALAEDQAQVGRVIDTYGLQFDMIFSMGLTEELLPTVEDYAKSGANRSREAFAFLAASRDSDRALRLMKDLYADRSDKSAATMQGVLEGIAQIHSPDAHDFVKEIFFDLDANEQRAVLSALNTGLNNTGGSASYCNPFTKQYNHSQRRGVPMRPVTREMYQRVLSLLDSLEQSPQCTAAIKQEIRAERESVRRYMR